MLRILFRISLAVSFPLFLQNCAQMSPLSGGATDRTPPKLVSATPLLYSTEFRRNTIYLKFNEYVQVHDLNGNLLVLPRLKSQPEVSVNGRTIKVELDSSELQDHTTYRIYFGQAIVDMNEGNPLNNFEYVFS